MSDENKTTRNDTDPAAQVAADLRARLRAMAAPELVELAAQLLTTYVVEGVVPLARAGESAELAQDAGGEESFAQMLKRLKAQKRDPVLEKFMIDGENISVRIEGYGTLPVTDYRRPNAPQAPGQAPAPQQRRESVPGAASSIYNRALYQPEAAPTAPMGAAPARGAPRPAPAGAPAANPANPAAPAQPGQKKDDAGKADRFALIELD